KPFTIFAPKNSPTSRAENLLQQPELVKRLLLDHVILSSKLDLTNLSTSDVSLPTLGGRTVTVRVDPKGVVTANNVTVLEKKIEVPNGPLSAVLDPKEAGKNQSNTSFVENVMEVLSFLKSRVRVFQHFVSRSNVSRLLREGEEYTVFVPTDHAFQRWHPIDWGFYPFSVPEFTESVIVNHFVKGRLKQETIRDGQVVHTLGGKEILFKRTR
ncbi:hypothetical protein D910_10747, partial [Dendroctonus ponderosae]